MEFIYTIHFLVTILSFFSMVSKDFRVVGGVIFFLHFINYCIVFANPLDILSSRYGLLPYAFLMDLAATVFILKFHQRTKDIFSMKVMVVMYFYALTHFLNFINLFIRWEVKTLSVYWGDLTQLVIMCKMYHNAYDNIIFGLTFILALLFIHSGTEGLAGEIDKLKRIFNSSRSPIGVLPNFNKPWKENIPSSKEMDL